MVSIVFPQYPNYQEHLRKEGETQRELYIKVVAERRWNPPDDQIKEARAESRVRK